MTTTQTYGPRNPRAMELAGVALRAAMQDNDQGVADALVAISSETGGEGLMDAILGLCDTLIARTPGVEVGKPIRIAWQEFETGQISSGPDEVRPTAVWAGRLLAARAADDHDMFSAIMESIPHGPKDVGDHVLELVQMVALNLRRAAERGGEVTTR